MLAHVLGSSGRAQGIAEGDKYHHHHQTKSIRINKDHGKINKNHQKIKKNQAINKVYQVGLL